MLFVASHLTLCPLAAAAQLGIAEGLGARSHGITQQVENFACLAAAAQLGLRGGPGRVQPLD